MDKATKQNEIAALTESFSKAQVALCAEYRGLTVGQITQLRRQLRGSGLHGRVVKNTLAKLSVQEVLKQASEAEKTKFLELFENPCFVIFSDEDPVSPAKLATQFGKEFKSFQVKGAWFEGTCLDKSGVESLSSMPSREETLAKLLALMQAPATQLLRLIKEPSSRVVRVLGAQRDKLEKAA